MWYWVYDGGDTESYTQIHCTRMLMLEHMSCYRGGDMSYWFGPFERKDQAEQKAFELGRKDQRDHTQRCMI